MCIEREIAALGRKLYDVLVYEIGDPAKWIYYDENGNLVDCYGNEYLDQTKAGANEEVKKWKKENERKREAAWLYLSGFHYDIRCEDLKKFVRQSDPTGIVTLAELWLLVDEHQKDFVDERALHSEFRTEQMERRQCRYHRLLILSRWLKVLPPVDKGYPGQFDEVVDTAFEETIDSLRDQSLKLFIFLHEKKYKTSYETLLAKVWKKDVLFSSVTKALERLADKLNKMQPQYYCVVIEKEVGRAKVDLLSQHSSS